MLEKINKKNSFVYEEAFSRNLGWVTPSEQQKIKNIVIAIPGVGGVGGHHLHVRMGFSKFKIDDLDEFEIKNFNRQYGSSLSSIGASKTKTLKGMVLDINPEASVETYDLGVREENIEKFLEGVDIICDGLDLYASHLRSPLYERAHQKGIFVLSAGPLEWGLQF